MKIKRQFTLTDLSNHTLGHLVTFITIFIWGTTFISTKILLEILSPIEILVFRFSLAYVLLLLIYPKYQLWTTVKEEALFVTLGGTGIFFYFILENIALQYTQASNVGVIVTSAPIFTALLAHFLLKDEKFHFSLVLGFLAAMTGVGMIMYEGATLSLNIKGDLLALAGALSFGIYSISLKKVDNRHHYILVTRKSFFYGLLWMLGYLALTSEKLHLNLLSSPIVMAHLVFLGVFASCLCFVLWNLGVRLIGSVKASNYIYLVPLVTVSTAIIILGEKMTSMMIVGAVMIVAGLFLAQNKFETMSNIFRKNYNALG